MTFVKEATSGVLAAIRERILADGPRPSAEEVLALMELHRALEARVRDVVTVELLQQDEQRETRMEREIGALTRGHVVATATRPPLTLGWDPEP